MAQIYNVEVMDSSAQLDAVFAALADPIRRDMLRRLARGPRSASELGGPFAISQPAASKHIATLERAGLLARHIHGRTHRLTLVAAPLRKAESWIARHRKFWEGSLDNLGRVLDEIGSHGR
jgi:DNA-binding transcriptional ArsR family regulator